MARAETVPAGEVELATRVFADDGIVPNNPRLPVVLMPGAVRPGAGPAAIRALMEANGWGGTWTYTVFDYHHYHSNAHEALICAAGWAEILLGGPHGETFRVREGDAIVLPAGTGHRRMADGDGFAMCGAYPPGQEDRDLIRADADPRGEAAARIAAVADPETCPVYGPGGPLIAAWSV